MEKDEQGIAGRYEHSVTGLTYTYTAVWRRTPVGVSWSAVVYGKNPEPDRISGIIFLLKGRPVETAIRVRINARIKAMYR